MAVHCGYYSLVSVDIFASLEGGQLQLLPYPLYSGFAFSSINLKTSKRLGDNTYKCSEISSANPLYGYLCVSSEPTDVGVFKVIKNTISFISILFSDYVSQSLECINKTTRNESKDRYHW